jgi:hypothetical protein
LQGCINFYFFYNENLFEIMPQDKLGKILMHEEHLKRYLHLSVKNICDGEPKSLKFKTLFLAFTISLIWFKSQF